jgi:ABC-2 type transport system ATP-binding protein
MNKPLISVEGLTKTYGERTVVADVSFSLCAGEILALLGPNGAGKTTTIKMALGLILPTSGYAEIMGYNMSQAKEMRIGTQHVGAVLEGARNAYWRLSALENLRYFGGLRGLPRSQIDDRAHDLLTRLDLIEQRDVEVRKFSRGMQQKVAIANALMHDPDILILDEPTLGLDVSAARLLEETVANLAEEGKAVLLTTHVMDLAQRLAGRIFVIHQGREVAHNETASLLQQFDARPITLIKVEQMPSVDWQQRFVGQFPGLSVQNGMFEWTAPSQPQILSLYRLLDEAGYTVTSVTRREPTLEEVFLSLIGDQRVSANDSSV